MNRSRQILNELVGESDPAVRPSFARATHANLLHHDQGGYKQRLTDYLRRSGADEGTAELVLGMLSALGVAKSAQKAQRIIPKIDVNLLSQLAQAAGFR